MRPIPNTLKMGAILSCATVAYAAAALAGPATKADLAGKKICRTHGRTTFGKDGSFYSTRYADGTWSLINGKLMVRTTNGGFTATIIKRQGIFQAIGYASGNEAPFGTWGKYCE
jgi:hypothetical protein